MGSMLVVRAPPHTRGSSGKEYHQRFRNSFLTQKQYQYLWSVVEFDVCNLQFALTLSFISLKSKMHRCYIEESVCNKFSESGCAKRT